MSLKNVNVYGDVLNAGKFIILDYEMAAPISYSYKPDLRSTLHPIIPSPFTLPKHLLPLLIRDGLSKQKIKKKGFQIHAIFKQVSLMIFR